MSNASGQRRERHSVQSYVQRQKLYRVFFKKFSDLVSFLIPNYIKKERAILLWRLVAPAAGTVRWYLPKISLGGLRNRNIRLRYITVILTADYDLK